MTSFKFNFSSTESVDENVEEKNLDNIQWKESEEIKLENHQLEFLDTIATHAQMYVYGDINIGHVIPSEVIQMISSKSKSLKLSEVQQSDLVPGTYEGGLKIWECTYDLIEYLYDNSKEITFKNKEVLDLGCGAGLLGIYGFLNEANVTFQDYNDEVLEYVTIPNVLLNIDEEEDRMEKISSCKFYSGDWSSFNKKLGSKKFDIILTSETIYNIQNQDKLLNLFTDRINEGGIIFVAAKSHYFGVGGGMRQFENQLQEMKHFHYETCWKCTDGIQREILKIKYIKS